MDGLSGLVERAQRGDTAAFDQLVRRFQDMAVGYSYSLLHDFHWAEDASQEAFIQAFLDLGTLRDPRAFPGWLRKLLFKQCDRRIRRRRVPTVALASVPETPYHGPGPAQAAEDRERRARIRAVIDDLPEKEREVTSLFYMGGYSQQEIGDFLELPLTTVKKRLQTARQRLRERMVEMVQDSLLEQAPSRDTRFANRVRAAISILDTGDVETLRSLLREDPTLVQAREYLDEASPHSRGYFRGAMLLHHVAGNPFRHELPHNIVEIARLLLESGAPVDGRTEEGNTTLGLVASSAEARRAGVKITLIDLLVQAGADLDVDRGAPMKLALAHGETAAADALAQHGAKLDLRFAAGIGSMDLVRSFYEDRGQLKSGACPDASGEPGAIEEEALRYACCNGQVEGVRFFLERGRNVNAPLAGGSTLLHNAVQFGREEMVRFLIGQGAEVNIRDAEYGGSALDWAVYLGKHRSTPADHGVPFEAIEAILRQHGGIEYFTSA